MSTSIVAESDLFREPQRTTLGLYIGLKEGAEIDLRVAAKAALSFDDFLRAFIEEVEPSAPVEITLIKGDTGSLNLLSSLSAKVSKKTLVALTIFAGGWIASQIASYTFAAVLDYLKDNLTDEQKLELSEADIEKMALACLKATANSKVIEKKDEISETLSQDQSVTGVGVTIGIEKTPKHFLPREKFSGVGGLLRTVNVTETGAETRTLETTADLILTEPVLIDKPRKWRFLLGRQEVSAAVSDEVFRQKALQGKLGIQISQGIVIRAVLATTEEQLEPNLWKPVKYELKNVISWKAEPSQISLIAPDTEEQE